MGTRYWITVLCPQCGMKHLDIWYAPTCGVTDFTCPDCGLIIDLEEYTGISEEGASNRKEIEAAIAAVLANHGLHPTA